jgi:MFS family permease
MSESRFQKIYTALVGIAAADSCHGIDEKSCREVPRNFLLTIISQFFSQLGDAIANPKVVLPWVMETVHAPLYLVGFLVPIRESGSMIPQLLVAGYIRHRAIRKWIWVLGSLLQACCIIGIGLVAWTLSGTAAGFSIIALLVLFSLSRCLSSVASKDIVGKTIPKKQRGRVTGWSASAAGLITVAFGAGLLLFSSREPTSLSYAIMLAGAGLLWLIAAYTYSQIKEFPGEIADGRATFIDMIKRLSILRSDKAFRRFVITRALLLCSALTGPYYVLLAQQHLGSPGGLLGLFIIASGTAGLLSSPIWGRFADLSSRRVMIAGALLTTLLGLAVFVIDHNAEHWLEQIWLLPLVYFVLSIAHQGVRIGRKTYVVDMAEGNKRTDYVSVGNTLIGIILLVLGFTGALAAFLSVSTIILYLSLMGGAGVILAFTLPEVE